MSDRMRAAVYTRYGPPEVVRVEEVDRPIPGDADLLIRVHATTVNRTDCGYRGGKPFLIRFFSGLRPRVRVLGTEFAGEVVAVGGAVTAFQVGEQVCGYCEGPFGAHAEYLKIAESRFLAHIPQDADSSTPPPAPKGRTMPWGCCAPRRVTSGSDVLVYGATGAIGSAAVQIAKSLGATVTAVCPTAYVGLVRGLGPDKVVDYLTEDFRKDDRRYDLVLDAVGKSTFGRCRSLLKPGGIYISSDLGPFRGRTPSWH